jgi:phosphonate transport system ATP-binding protein
MAQATREVLIEAKAISKTYAPLRGAARAADGAPPPPVKALSSVDFVMHVPERIALIGPSGSGKSTLLRALSGLLVLDADAGVIKSFGEVVQHNGRLSPRIRKIRANMGMVAQQFNLVGRLSLFSNVALGLLGRVNGLRGLFGQWSRSEKQKIMAALDRVGIADRAAQRASSLSGGQQQRGAIARAMVQDAKILLADEPVASLDPVSARKVMELMVAMHENNGVGVVVTLHQVDFAKKYCTRILALKSGRVVYDGPSDGLGLDRLKEIYGDELEAAYWGDQ